MLHWANQSNILIFFDSNEYQHTSGKYECLCAVNAVHVVRNDNADFKNTSALFRASKDWLFGHISYDFKNELAPLHSLHPKHIAFPNTFFFQAEIVCYIERGSNQLNIESLGRAPELIWEAIQQEPISNKPSPSPSIRFEKRMNQDAYLKVLQALKQHIIEGDCYEINFCNEAYCTDANIDPLSVFERLNKKSPAPFAAYYKLEDQYLMCASPERYLQKLGSMLRAQPIKGTAKRGSDSAQDEQQKMYLSNSYKERAENVMIVDLMRNDLAQCSIAGSVQVEELFGLYTFPQVHQLISTIKAKLRPELTLFDALKYSFPMGSMTGAPKLMVMQLIEHYEEAYRGLFSGALGYISPEGDFDFNVVIRSLFYNEKTSYLSYQSGGAITYDSEPMAEWEETLLKANAIEEILSARLK